MELHSSSKSSAAVNQCTFSKDTHYYFTLFEDEKQTKNSLQEKKNINDKTEKSVNWLSSIHALKGTKRLVWQQISSHFQKVTQMESGFNFRVDLEIML